MSKICYKHEEEKAVCMKHKELYKNGKAMEVQNKWEHRRTSKQNYSPVCYTHTWRTEDTFFWTIWPIRVLVTRAMRKMAFQLCPAVPHQNGISYVLISDIIFSLPWVFSPFPGGTYILVQSRSSSSGFLLPQLVPCCQQCYQKCYFLD